jgi:hypothetical protein
MRNSFVILALLAAAAGTLSCTPDPGGKTILAGEVPPQIVLAAGDIADCDSSGDEATAALLDTRPGTVLTLGDNAYPDGTATQFANCYDPTWGRHKSRTRPSAGNHEYHTAGAAGYYGYFGSAAGDPSKGYYSFDLGAWHLIALNSNCSAIGGCGAGSPQERWLRADLAANPADCVLAYWHHPRFSSAQHGNSVSMQPFWQALYDYRAEIVLSGHDHTYERFAPQTPSGGADPQYGIREFVVGTGGRGHYGFGSIKPNSEARSTGIFAVLKLTLSTTGYAWEFVPEAGESFADTGNRECKAGNGYDSDYDLHANTTDNCPSLANPAQADADTDGLGDDCEAAAGASPADADSDDDMCFDGSEVRLAPPDGGDRDPSEHFDFFDVTADRAVDLTDTLVVLNRFGAGPSEDEYDRSAPDDDRPWRSAAANDGIDLTDALVNLLQFGHECTLPP